MMQTIGYEICQSARRVYQYLDNLFAEYDITPEQWVIIKHLFQAEGISQKELSFAVRKDKNTTKAIVDKLVVKGYIHRICNPSDKRAFMLTLTPKAKSMIPKLAKLDEKMIEVLTNGLSNEELEFLSSILKKIQKNLCLDWSE